MITQNHIALERPAARRARKTKATLQPGEVLLSRRQIAERWGVSWMTIKRREQAGELTPVWFNCRRVRYRLDEVLRCEAAATGAVPVSPNVVPAPTTAASMAAGGAK